MTSQHAAIEQYMRTLEHELQALSRIPRETILDDVRTHITDAVHEGRPLDEVLTALGSPQTVAGVAREELGIGVTATPAERAARMLHIASVALAVVTAVFVSFILPSYATEEVGVTIEGTGSTLQTATSLFEQMGLGVALLTLIPAGLALLPLMLVRWMRTPAALSNAVVMTLFSVVAGLSIGGFYAPLALLMWAALLVPRWATKGRSATTSRVWRILGGIMIVAPAVLAIVGLITGTFADGGLPFWVVSLVVLALGVTFALRVRFIDVAVAVLGAALMALAVVDAGILVLAVWWAGGLWLTAGLAAIAARRSAPAG